MQKEATHKKQQPKKQPTNQMRDHSRIIPFIVPTKQQRMDALGTLAGQKWSIKKSLLSIIDSFDPIREPKPGDHLYEVDQPGQGYGLYTSRRKRLMDRQTQVVYLCLFHSKISKETMKSIKKNVKGFFYGAKVKLHEPPSPNLQMFNPIEGPNKTLFYDSGKINEYFSKHIPKDSYAFAVITNLLLYHSNGTQQPVEERWVFGLGSIKYRTCVISFEQIIIKTVDGIRQKGGDDQDKVNIEVLQKVVNHEICHTFGLRHCIYYQCLMNGSYSYEQSLRKQPHLCPVCLRKLQYALQFKFEDRYDALGDEKSKLLADKINNVLTIKYK